MLFTQALTGFLISLSADRYSPKTIDSYRLHLSSIASFLQDKPVECITESDLRSYFAWLNSEYVPHRASGGTYPLAGSSVNKIWIAMRSFFGWCERESLIATRPDRAIRQPTFSTKAIIPFSQNEVIALLKSCAKTRHPRRDTAIVLVLLDTGIRSGECARLQVGDIDLNSGSVTIRPYNASVKSRPRVVFIGKSARRALWRYLAMTPTGVKSPDSPLFGVTTNGLRLLFARLGKLAGVVGCHPHKMRHTFSITYLRNSGDALSLQRLLGHATLAMTEKYVALADADLANIFASASPVDCWRL